MKCRALQAESKSRLKDVKPLSLSRDATSYMLSGKASYGVQTSSPVHTPCQLQKLLTTVSTCRPKLHTLARRLLSAIYQLCAAFLWRTVLHASDLSLAHERAIAT